MSYTITTNGKGDSAVKVIVMHCNDESGCKAQVATDKGENKGTFNARVRAIGWRGFSATEHYCPQHSNFRSAKKGEGKVTKAKVAQTKAEKVATPAKSKTTKSGAKMTVGNRVPAKTNGEKVTAGQSIGKLARSAKKSAVK